mmetsp:Transcript_27952/g.41280  ORF Transcript_27952/g.41280 Transcript_27952/m.41280 type:complete len:920 (+) Transcript_27952:162-2921(+)|eukprot:CAMPEP_0194221460 /NCGR_PEP_ID=MMETSP0156-20130528/30601_1 /TAXON_ID=33649 /ORGANISM="Thalassionema nitzschioides, Strain L26-B" /LENGTH=919 /DNA_ID=CAMNT_0038951855 /DNA_START=155 /DNA_END=2914 /DNA_ORIENTATION=+
MADSPDPEHSGLGKSRSANDFDDAAALLNALKDTGRKSSFVHIGRDFPRALIGSSLGVPREDDDMSDCSTIFEPGTEQDWVIKNCKAESSESQTLDQELRRLQVLKSYLILDSEREASFERLTGLAARMFRVPIALVSLVDLGRQWFMSNRGLGDTRETPRKFAFCAHTIISKEDLLIVKDASKDPRFKDNPLVTGPPHIRFYGGAPLLCPEGYKLGTLCIIDNKVRTEEFTLEEKQNLRELASLVVDAMVQRRREKMRILEDKSQIIATTAHDLLTPLSGVQMSLSLLMDDKELMKKVTSSERDLMETAYSCGNVMQRICHQAIGLFRGDGDNQNNIGGITTKSQSSAASRTIIVAEFVKNLKMVMEPYPKKVPLFISVDPLVPSHFVSDDLKVFRSTVNYLTNALQKTENGNVHLKIFVGNKKSKPRLVFECEDTGQGVPIELYPYLFRPRKNPDEEQCVRVNETGLVDASPVCNPNMKHHGLGLFSVANQISSIGGEYGYRPRDDGNLQNTDLSKSNGAIFWFSIPLVVPNGDDSSSKSSSVNDMIVTSKRGIQDENMNYRKIRTISEVEVNTEDISDDTLSQADPSGLDQQLQGQAKLQNIDTAGKRVRHALIIDDSVVIRKSMSKALTKQGFKVTHAVNGLEGLKHLQQQVFDIVLCDYLMPVMDGLDCVQQYRDWEEAHRPWFHQYIIGISAHASISDVEKGKKAGMNEFKSKPITMKNLQALIASPQIVEVSKTLDGIGTIQEEADNDDVEMVYRSEFSHSPQTHPRCETSEEGPACLIAEPPSNSVMKEAVENLGWCAVQVFDGEDALRLLKMRNWDAVFMENEIERLSGTGCIARFRQWEEENRVARQNNIFLLSTDFVPSPTESVSAVYPAGFNGALGKPILMKDLKKLLQCVANNIEESANSKNIVAR